MTVRQRTRPRWIGLVGLVGLVGLALAACGAESAPSTGAPLGETVEIPEVAPAPRTPAAAPAAVEAPTSPSPRTRELDQPAIWPAADVIFATPEEAAADFVSSVLITEGDPVLGPFQPGDTRSGEIAVLFAGETGDLDPPHEHGILLLRQIGPTDGWYVIAAVSEGVRIDAPAALGPVTAGTITVSGQGRGFEGTLAVSAFPPGEVTAPIDTAIGAGGAFADPEPFSVELDLSGVADGDVVVILVRGDTGLGSDPGTFAALPIVVTSAPPETTPPTTTAPATPPPTLPPTR